MFNECFNRFQVVLVGVYFYMSNYDKVYPIYCVDLMCHLHYCDVKIQRQLIPYSHVLTHTSH